MSDASKNRMQLAQEGGAVATGNIPTIRLANFQTLYSNAIRIGISAWDIRLTCGQLLESAVNQFLIEEQVTIILSPQSAKVLLTSLGNSVELYERQFGQIIVSQGVPGEVAPAASTGSRP